MDDEGNAVTRPFEHDARVPNARTPD